MRGRTNGLLSALLAAAVLVACGGAGSGGSGHTPGVPQFTVGGSLSGLGAGKAVSLQINGGDAVTLGTNGPFSFGGQFADGFTYNVTALLQPLGETCAVSNGGGTVGSTSVTSVAVTCTPNLYSIGGQVFGFTSDNVTLQNNGGGDISITSSTPSTFTFAPQVADGATYSVTVSLQPTTQTCTVERGNGTVSGNAVANVAVICNASAFTVGGTVSGLTGGTSVVLQNNRGETLTRVMNAPFGFTLPVASGATYSVTVLTQPADTSCSVANGTGTIANSNVPNVAVSCAANAFTVGGTLSGLSGTLVLQNNGGDSLTLSNNGPFTFATAVANGGTYAVSVPGQPTGETCLVANASGTVSGADIANVAVTCGVPDLVPVNATFVQQLGGGAPVTASVTAGNAGSVASPATTAAVLLYSDAACGTVPVKTMTAGIGALAPSSVGSGVTVGTIVSPGTYPSQSVNVDFFNAVAESNESNNTRCLTTPLVVH